MVNKIYMVSIHRLMSLREITPWRNDEAIFKLMRLPRPKGLAMTTNIVGRK
jgi:hypothetical protein